MVVQGKGHPFPLVRTCLYFSMKLNYGFRLSSSISVCAAYKSHLQKEREISGGEALHSIFERERQPEQQRLTASTATAEA